MKKHIVILSLIPLFFASATAQNSFKLILDTAQTEINKGNYEKALQFYDKAFEVGSNDTSNVIWAATICSMTAIELKKEQKAMVYNNIALEFGSTEQSLIDQQLDLAKKHKDLETTEKVLLLMQKIPALSEKYTIKLLYFYYNNQRFTETIVAANKVLASKPDYINAKFLKGIALLQTSDKNAAVEVFQDILTEQPEHKKANKQFGLLYYNKASEIFDIANKSYKSLKEPTRLDYHTYRKEILKAKADYEKCLPYLEKSYSLAAEDYLEKAISLTKNRLRQLKEDN